MGYRKVFWGVILVLIGMLFLLKNLDFIDFSWYAFWQLWPVLLLLWGISILPVNSALRLSLSVLVVIGTLWIASERGDLKRHSFRWSERHTLQDDRDDRKDYEKEYEDEWKDPEDTSYAYNEQVIREPMDDSILSAVLRLDAAAGEFYLEGSTDDLLLFEKKGRMARYNILSKRIGESQVIDLSLQNTKIRGNVNNEVSLSLNTKPVWDFDLDIGAAEVEFDLSGHKVEDVKVDGGACSVRLKFSDLHNDVKIDIDAGAASIELQIPEGAGCEVEAETFLTSKDLKGFEKLERGKYRTPDYEEADVKFHISMDAAIASFEIERY